MNSATHAQAFDIWDYLSLRYESEDYDHTNPSTRAIQLKNLQIRVSERVKRELASYLPIVAVKSEFLDNYPNSNVVTQSILSTVVPQGETADRELRYLAAFKREAQLTYSALFSRFEVALLRAPSTDPQAYSSAGIYSWIPDWVREVHYCAKQVADTMGLLEGYLMTDLASDVDFVRDSARVTLGEQHGFKLTAGRQNLYVTVRSGATRALFSPLRSVDCRELHLIEHGTAQSATCSITPKGPVLIKVGTATGTVQATGVVRSLTSEEIKQGVKVTPIDVPSVLQHVANQTVEATTTQTVNWSGTFAGQELTYAVSSSQASVATAVLSSDPGVLAITGHRAGNTNISLTASNAAGNAVTRFIVTVTPRSE